MIAVGSVMFAEHRNGTFDVSTSKSRLDLVLNLLDHGGIGHGAHGNAEHRAALIRVIEVAQQIIAKIDKPPPRTCNKHDDCDKADVDAKAKGRDAYHCHADDCEECFGC